MRFVTPSGRGGRDRTADFLLVKKTLLPLSYTPVTSTTHEAKKDRPRQKEGDCLVDTHPNALVLGLHGLTGQNRTDIERPYEKRLPTNRGSEIETDRAYTVFGAGEVTSSKSFKSGVPWVTIPYMTNRIWELRYLLTLAAICGWIAVDEVEHSNTQSPRQESNLRTSLRRGSLAIRPARR